MWAKTTWIAATHQGRASRRADGLNVVLIQFDAFTDQLVHAWRFPKSVVPANITPAQIIGDNEQDVWSARYFIRHAGSRTAKKYRDDGRYES